jgi:hypothetical protein
VSNQAGDYGVWKVELRHPILAILDERRHVGIRHRRLPIGFRQVRCLHHGTHLAVSLAGRSVAGRALLPPSQVDELRDVVFRTLFLGWIPPSGGLRRSFAAVVHRVVVGRGPFLQRLRGRRAVARP